MHVYKLTMASIEGSTMVDYSIQLVWPDVVFTDKILGKVKTVMDNKELMLHTTLSNTNCSLTCLGIAHQCSLCNNEKH